MRRRLTGFVVVAGLATGGTAYGQPDPIET